MPPSLTLSLVSTRRWVFTEPVGFSVVGGGLAGGVVSNRLASAGYSVLLLEAGGEPYPLQMIPGLMMLMLNNPATDWMYRSVPQDSASLNSKGRESSWSVGKGLGGTGTINIMIYLRGHSKDYDNWAKLVNDSGWGWEGVLPHFKEIEDYSEKMGKVDVRYHGEGGELLVDEPDYLGIADEWIAAAGEFGYPKVDMNAPYEEGFDRIKYPIQDGRRIASYFAFIEKVRRMDKFTLLKYAHVNKVLINENNQVVGVEYEKFGKIYTALAKKEVVLSAGTVNTAKILLLSGIGPQSHLESVGIRVRRDAPVGENLQDHIGVYLHPFFIRPPYKTIRVERDMSLKALGDWVRDGKGVLTSTGVQASGCISSSFAKSRGEGGWPDLHLFLHGFSATSKVAGVVAHAFNLEEKELESYFRDGDREEDSFNIIVSGARPYSKGTVTLASSDPKDPPIIDPKYLRDENETDVQVLLEGVKRSVEMMEGSEAIGKRLGVRFTDKKLPGCEEYEMRSDEYWICYIRRYTVTLHHPVGTTRMGKLDDPEAVVDTRLRVIGFSGLRVVDNSIQPVIIVTNTGSSAMMIGAKGAELILEDWREQKEISEIFEDDNNNSLKKKRRGV